MFVVFIAVMSCFAQVKKSILDTTMSGMHIELHMDKAESLFTKEQASGGAVKEGMLILGGAEPLLPNAEIKPNIHLGLHIFDVKSTAAITNAKVEMSLQRLDTEGNQMGGPIEIPVVVMETLGKGVQSTHYGNNVVMLDGPYVVFVSINGKKLKFTLNRLYTPNVPIQYMDMHE